MERLTLHWPSRRKAGTIKSIRGGDYVNRVGIETKAA